MKLDIIIPTCNRQALLSRTLRSISAACEPRGLETHVMVVDNNSVDRTADAVRQAMTSFGGRLRYLREPRQGKPYALNAGIALTGGDLIGLIDDDEEIHPRWPCIVYDRFKTPSVDFIGGPYIPRWTAPPPEWFPPSYRAAIGWSEAEDTTVREFGPDFPGILMGGNAVIRRSVLQRCGPYSTLICRTPTRLLSGEDEEMYHRLLSIGARGLYIPDLIIFHHVFPERLTKPYFRRWAFWRGVALGIQNRSRPSPAPQLMGVPRWYYKLAAAGAAKRLRRCFGHPSANAFKGELDVLTLAGLLYGNHWFGREDVREMQARPSPG